MSFYAKMQATASRLLAKFRQGAVVYIEQGSATGDPWNPQPSAPTRYTLDATVSGVTAGMVDQTNIQRSDLQVIAAFFGTVPVLSGQVEIDGHVCEIVQIDAIPSAGVTVAWRLFVRA